MEEKKQTVEEIVNDIERATGMPSYWKKIVLDTIKYLQDELKQVKCNTYKTGWKNKFFKANEEIERLTREVDKQKNFVTAWEESWKIANEKNTKIRVKLKKENAELQKQVDELKGKLYKSKQDMLVYHSNQMQQTVKDTAKEILQGFNKWLKQAISDSYEIAVLNSGGFHGGRNRAFHEVKDLVKKVAESKGVEVD